MPTDVEIKINFFGQPMELTGKKFVLFKTHKRTVREILKELARRNPILSDLILNEKGDPRRSTYVLIGGRRVENLDDEILLGKDTVIVLCAGGACDG